jgi:hypothetical protein
LQLVIPGEGLHHNSRKEATFYIQGGMNYGSTTQHESYEL